MTFSDGRLSEVAAFIGSLPPSPERDEALGWLKDADTELADTLAYLDDEVSRAGLYLAMLEDEGLEPA